MSGIVRSREIFGSGAGVWAGRPGKVYPRHRGRSVWPFLGFMLISMGLIWVVTRIYLLKALTDFNTADAKGRRLIGLHALLVMSLVLVVLLGVLVVIFRVGRFFFPRPFVKRTSTQYTDAWAEAGKRMQPPK
jgi:hypothetical protein